MGLPTLPCTCSTVCSAIEEKLDAYELFDADRARFASGELRSGLHARGCRPRISERLLARLNLTLPERLPASPRSSWPGSTRCSSLPAHAQCQPISPFQFCRTWGFFGAFGNARDLSQLPHEKGFAGSSLARQESRASCARYSSRPRARHYPQSRRYVPGSVFDGMA